MQVQGLVGISNTSNADAASPVQAMGKQADALVSEVHGKYYSASYRSRVYLSAGAAAGTTIPVSTTTAPTFTLYNPIGSGVILEPISLNVSILNVATVASGISLGILSGLTVAPTGVTLIPCVLASTLATTVPNGQLWSAATIAAAATRFYTLFSISSTTGAFSNNNYRFDGELLVPPGAAIFLAGTAAQTSATLNSMSWAEWPQ